MEYFMGLLIVKSYHTLGLHQCLAPLYHLIFLGYNSKAKLRMFSINSIYPENKNKTFP